MKLVLFDIDGVLADDRHRQHHALAERWSDYFADDVMMFDPVWKQGDDLMHQALHDGYRIGYCTGRREDTRRVTEAWLTINSFPVDLIPLYMKPLSGKTKTPVYKAATIETLMNTDGLEVILYDDDPDVCAEVNRACGSGTAIHCTWHIKPIEMVRRSET